MNKKIFSLSINVLFPIELFHFFSFATIVSTLIFCIGIKKNNVGPSKYSLQPWRDQFYNFIDKTSTNRGQYMTLLSDIITRIFLSTHLFISSLWPYWISYRYLCNKNNLLETNRTHWIHSLIHYNALF